MIVLALTGLVLTGLVLTVVAIAAAFSDRTAWPLLYFAGTSVLFTAAQWHSVAGPATRIQELGFRDDSLLVSELTGSVFAPFRRDALDPLTGARRARELVSTPQGALAIAAAPSPNAWNRASILEHKLGNGFTILIPELVIAGEANSVLLTRGSVWMRVALDGTHVWEREWPELSQRALLPHETSLFVITNDGEVVALDLHSGAIAWRYRP